MKKQSGFTLIELMVVMAIIAILATAGLAAYTGYIKKARDTTRIADLGALNTIVLGMVGTTGKPPATAKEVYDAARTANNDKPIVDPLSESLIASGHYVNDSSNFRASCYMGTTASKECNYTYRLCDGGTGFAVGARFESKSNADSMYTSDGPDDSTPSGATDSFTSRDDASMFEIGSCTTRCSTAGTTITCPAGTYPNAPIVPTVLENAAAASQTSIGV